MARYGDSDDQNYYSEDEPTQLSNYGYDEPPAAEPETPWFRKPASLVAFGAIGAVLIALVVFGLAKAITGDSGSETTSTTPLTPLTRRARHHPRPPRARRARRSTARSPSR